MMQPAEWARACAGEAHPLVQVGVAAAAHSRAERGTCGAAEQQALLLSRYHGLQVTLQR